jgi:AcrR family transcriptional regulator
MASIALEAHVSKALLHYHFADRAHLLAEMTHFLGRRLEQRERMIFAHANGTPAIDQLWKWLAGELDRGELRALLLLGTLHNEAVSQAVSVVSAARRDTMTNTVERLLARLYLTPRVAPALIADATMTFNEGLALRGDSRHADARTSFDVFWLAVLSLGE